MSKLGKVIGPLKRGPMATNLDSDARVRSRLVKRIHHAIDKPDIPVAVLHQVAQCIEMWHNQPIHGDRR